jgi:hypothetical protein
MDRTMDDQINRSAPRAVIEALDASVRDIAEGRLQDARAVQADARRMLAEHQAGRSTAPAATRANPPRRNRSIS